MLSQLYLWLQPALSREKGQDLIEYALLVFFIALVVIGAVELVGLDVQAVFNDIAEAL